MQGETNQQKDTGLKEFQQEIDQLFTTIIHSLPPELVKYIKQKFSETQSIFKSEKYRLELVVDTNIVFAEVRSLMVNNSSFFLKIADNPFIKIYAPSQLKSELYDKIKIKFPKDSKTKHFAITECLIKADLLLSKITFHDDFSNNSLQKAKTHIEERDPKDISFVALSLTLNSHGILTKDKDISDIEEIKTWDLRETGKVITEINKGTFSFFILNVSLPSIWDVIYELVVATWSAFIQIVQGLISFFTSIMTGSVNAIANMPPELALLIGGAALFLMNVAELRGKVGEFIKMLWEQIIKFIKVIKEFFKAMWDLLMKFIEALKPMVKVSLQLLEYLILQSGVAFNRLVELEASRPE